MEEQKKQNQQKSNFNLQVEKCKLEWKLPKYYEITQILGQGAYGHVIEARDTRTNSLVAIKRISNLFKSQGDTKRNLREITLLRKLKHKNIVKLLDVIVEGDFETCTTIYLIMEKFPSDLKKLLRSPIYLTNQHIALLSYNILIGLKYLSRAGVLHRDIKPANILINEDCDIKLCDFGLARAFNERFEDPLTLEQQQNEKDIMKSPEIQDQTQDLGAMSGTEITKFQEKIDHIFEKDSNNNNNKNDQKNKNDKKITNHTNSDNKIIKAQPNEYQHSHHKNSMDDQVFELMNHQPQIKKQRVYSCDEGELFVQPIKRTPKRGLTRHVVTRWYRAPELILLEKKYDEQVDLWSFGCVFAELQGSMKTNIPNYKDRRAIFPGSSCFPLSPKKNDSKKLSSDTQQQQQTLNGGIANLLPKVRQDQLQMIFSVIGTPTKQETDFIQDQNAKKYIQSFSKIPPLNLEQVYPGSDLEAIKILQKIFRFNPKDRSTIDQLLESPFFNQFRNKQQEQMLNKVQPIEMELEFEEEITPNIIREYYIKEFNYYLDTK